MPYQDGTGPMGNGRPGRGQGPCGRGRIINGRPGIRGGFFGRRFASRNVDTAADPESAIYPYTQEELLIQKKELEDKLDWIQKLIAEKK